jgi:hypothetical protein
MFSKESKTSNLVKQRSVTEFKKTAFFRATRSNHPHLLGLPVVAPNSCPLSASIFALSSNSSVKKGPSPTLVAYAFEIPTILSINFGPTPIPVETPPAVVLEEVTYG